MKLEEQKKKCSKCRKTKSVSDFFMDKQKKDGLTSSCKKCVMQSTSSYRHKNKDAYRTYAQEYHKKTKHLKRKRRQAMTKNVVKEIFDLLGDKCSCCNFSNILALQIDHVYGDGYKHRKKLRGLAYYKDILRSVKKKEGRYQILCANCNFIEGIKKGYRGSIWT